MLAALLNVTGDPEITYHLMLRLWNDMNFKRHYVSNDGNYDICHNIMKELGNYVTLMRPNIAQHLHKHERFDVVVCNLYAIIMSNFGFTGQVGGGLCMESALQMLLFHLITFSEDEQDTPFIFILMAMLEICEEQVLALTDKNQVMKYVG